MKKINFNLLSLIISAFEFYSFHHDVCFYLWSVSLHLHLKLCLCNTSEVRQNEQIVRIISGLFSFMKVLRRLISTKDVWIINVWHKGLGRKIGKFITSLKISNLYFLTSIFWTINCATVISTSCLITSLTFLLLFSLICWKRWRTVRVFATRYMK